MLFILINAKMLVSFILSDSFCKEGHNALLYKMNPVFLGKKKVQIPQSSLLSTCSSSIFLGFFYLSPSFTVKIYRRERKIKRQNYGKRKNFQKDKLEKSTRADGLNCPPPRAFA